MAATTLTNFLIPCLYISIDYYIIGVPIHKFNAPSLFTMSSAMRYTKWIPWTTTAKKD